MPVAEELITLLGYDIKGQQKLREYQRGLDQAEKNAKGTAAGIAAAGKSLGGFLVGVGASAAVASAVKRYAGLERTMGRIGITAGASRIETLGAMTQVQNLAKQYALTTDQSVAGLDTLTASGMDLRQAMEFLPSVLLTAQAAGAATEDIANTAIKTASALKIQASQMQDAFDIMVAGGKAGQFELKDMAAYIPELANSFSTLGYQGEDGLKILIATLQTLREDTGSAGAAATQAQNIFGKMLSGETINSFKKKFGIDLPKAMKKAEKQGVDALSAFIEISEQALNGDLSKLPLLFTDQEFRLGMQSLLTSKDRLKAFYDTVNNGRVRGGALRDFNTIAGDTQASIDRMWTSWDKFQTSVGKFAAPGVTSFLDTLSKGLDKYEAGGNRRDAELAGLEKSGMNWLQARAWLLDPRNGKEEHDAIARKGGWAPTDEARAVQAAAPYAYEKLGRLPNRPVTLTPAAQANPGRGGRRRTLENTPDVNSRIPGAYDEGWRLQLERNKALMPGGASLGSPQRDEALLPANATPLSGAYDDIMAKVGRAMELGGGGAGAASVANDMSTTNNITQTISAPVTVTVQQAVEAPRAVGNAIAAGIERGARAVPSRMQSGLSPQ